MSLPALLSKESLAGYTVTKSHDDFVTMHLDNQMFGIPVLAVQDVLRGQRIARVPLAPSAIAGSMNLRGRIVTVMDLRVRLALPSAPYTTKTMSVVVEHNGELFSLLVDSVGDVLSLPKSQFETSPANLMPRWREVSSGVYKLKNELLVIIDVASLMRTAV